jgi:hypothetical protein
LKRSKFKSKIKTLKEVNLIFEIFHQNIFGPFENRPDQICNAIGSVMSVIGAVQGYSVYSLGDNQNAVIG